MVVTKAMCDDSCFSSRNRFQQGRRRGDCVIAAVRYEMEDPAVLARRDAGRFRLSAPAGRQSRLRGARSLDGPFSMGPLIEHADKVKLATSDWTANWLRPETARHVPKRSGSAITATESSGQFDVAACTNTHSKVPLLIGTLRSLSGNSCFHATHVRATRTKGSTAPWRENRRLSDTCAGCASVAPSLRRDSMTRDCDAAG